MPAKYLSKERFSKANVVLAFNKEKGRLFSLNSLRLLQTMELLPTCCTQQLCLPLTRDVHKKAKPWQQEKTKRNTYFQNNTNISHPNVAEYLWSVSSYLAPNNLDHLCPEITLPQTSRIGTQTASRHLASTSGLGLDGIPVQRAEYFLFSFTHKLNIRRKIRVYFPSLAGTTCT